MINNFYFKYDKLHFLQSITKKESKKAKLLLEEMSDDMKNRYTFASVDDSNGNMSGNKSSDEKLADNHHLTNILAIINKYGKKLNTEALTLEQIINNKNHIIACLLEIQQYLNEIITDPNEVQYHKVSADIIKYIATKKFLLDGSLATCNLLQNIYDSVGILNTIAQICLIVILDYILLRNGISVDVYKKIIKSQLCNNNQYSPVEVICHNSYVLSQFFKECVDVFISYIIRLSTYIFIGQMSQNKYYTLTIYHNILIIAQLFYMIFTYSFWVYYYHNKDTLVVQTNQYTNLSDVSNMSQYRRIHFLILRKIILLCMCVSLLLYSIINIPNIKDFSVGSIIFFIILLKSCITFMINDNNFPLKTSNFLLHTNTKCDYPEYTINNYKEINILINNYPINIRPGIYQILGNDTQLNEFKMLMTRKSTNKNYHISFDSAVNPSYYSIFHLLGICSPNSIFVHNSLEMIFSDINAKQILLTKITPYLDILNLNFLFKQYQHNNEYHFGEQMCNLTYSELVFLDITRKLFHLCHRKDTKITNILTDKDIFRGVLILDNIINELSNNDRNRVLHVLTSLINSNKNLTVILLNKFQINITHKMFTINLQEVFNK